MQATDPQPRLDRTGDDGSEAVGIADLWLALGSAAVALALYVLARQPRLYGDGPGLATMVGLEPGVDYHHVGYLPAARAIGALFRLDAVDAVVALSSLSAAAAVALLFGFLRRVGLSRAAALFGVAGWAAAPGTLFFATTAEVHMPHAAALALCLFAVAWAPWRRPVLATLLVAPALALLHWTHVSAPLLGFGLVVLVKVVTSGDGGPSWGRVLLGVGPVWLLALLLAMSASSYWRGQGFTPLGVDKEVEILSDYATLEDPLAIARHNLAPFAWLVVFALVGVTLRLRGVGLMAFTTLILPSWIFFSVWGVKEFGGYFVPTALLLAWPLGALVGGGVAPSRVAGAALVLAAVQLTEGASWLVEWNRGWDYDDRARAVAEALPVGGTLVVPWRDAPSTQLWLPDVRELDIAQQVSRGMLAGAPPEVMVEAARGLQHLLEAGPVAVDLSFEARADFHGPSGRIEYFRALARALESQYVTERFEHGLFVVVRILPR